MANQIEMRQTNDASKVSSGRLGALRARKISTGLPLPVEVISGVSTVENKQKSKFFWPHASSLSHKLTYMR